MLSQDQAESESEDGDFRDAQLGGDLIQTQDHSSEDDTEEEALKECTFRPNINKSAVPARTVDDLIDWGK